ncbi:hypothetical protein HHK36_019338 [Tetracentron sinense]|uniref:Cytochrome b-c1 complex subunit 9 n=1 Tax=Tetracentron sinense TaxID=13715 RepID=A0A834Z218_TETSI|nr:hypothetical protein HHK36_019338 [Tetracentron sinense]
MLTYSPKKRRTVKCPKIANNPLKSIIDRAGREGKHKPEQAMDSTARRSGGGLLEGLYRVIMRRNSVYVTFIVAGAFVGERIIVMLNANKIRKIDDLVLPNFGI